MPISSNWLSEALAKAALEKKSKETKEPEWEFEMTVRVKGTIAGAVDHEDVKRKLVQRLIKEGYKDPDIQYIRTENPE